MSKQQIRDPLDQLHGRGGLEMGYFGLLVLLERWITPTSGQRPDHRLVDKSQSIGQRN